MTKRSSDCKAVFLLCSIMLLLPVFSVAEPVEWSGSLKSLYIYSRGSASRQTPETHYSSNRARINTFWKPSGNWQFETAVDYQYLWLDPVGDLTPVGSNQNRHIDMSKVWEHGAASSHLQVDRLSIRWNDGPLDVTFGRQAVGFGRILVYSPLDIIAPFAPDAIDTDIRSGIDALQSTFNYRLDGQMRGIVVWGDERSDNSYLGTWSDNSHGLDMLLLGGSLRGRNVGGMGIAGDLGSLGLKGEITFHQGKDVGTPGGDLYRHYSIGAIEAWYRFNNGLSLITQYLYNGAGENQPAAYPNVLVSAPVREGLTHLLGRHYLIAVPAYELHPLINIQGVVIYNIKDGSCLCRPMLDLNLSDNVSLQLFYTWNFGSSPKSTGHFTPPAPTSEFGMRSNSAGLFFKWYF